MRIPTDKRISHRKGLSMIEEYGIEKANRIKNKISKNGGHLQIEKTRKKISNSLKGHSCYKNPERGKKISKHKIGDLNPMRKVWVKEIHKKSMQYITHHINGNHFDDRPENKQIMTQSKHVKLHHVQGDIKK